jgi:hypothetical protein
MLRAMNRKQLAKILPTVIGIGFCLIEGMKLAFQFQATDKKDIASGNVEPIRFAPVISSDWDYITTPQMIALAVAMVAVMALAAVMLTSRWWAKDRPETLVAEPSIAPPSPPAAASQPIPRSFGRRTH